MYSALSPYKIYEAVICAFLAILLCSSSAVALDRQSPFSFLLEMEGMESVVFEDLGGVASKTEVVEHVVVDENGIRVIQKIPGRLSQSAFVLTRKVTNSLQMSDWRQGVEQGKIDEVRRDGSVTMLDYVGNEVARWHVAQAWPSAISIVKENNRSFESVTLVYDSATREAVETNGLVLESFGAEALIDQIALSFSTGAEPETAGFFIQRSVGQPAGYSRIHEKMIPAAGTENRGAQYSHTDTQVVPGKSYYYLLEQVTTSGKSYYYPMSDVILVEDIEKIKQLILVLQVLSGSTISENFAARLTEEFGVVDLSDAIKLLQNLSTGVSL